MALVVLADVELPDVALEVIFPRVEPITCTCEWLILSFLASARAKFMAQ
jgi:hypothetical protein